MPEHRYDFGLAAAIAAEAMGEPGQRTFRLLVRNDTDLAVLWMEKEQLQALAMAAEELLAQVPERRQSANATVEEADPKHFQGTVDVEFKIGQLGIGYDEDGSYFVLLVHEVETDPETPATFRCLLTRPQLAVLGQQAKGVVAAGRPRCPLCGSPLEPAPHLCPQSNGHGSPSEISQ